MNSNMNNDSNLNNDSNIKNGSNIKNDSNINNGSNTNNDMYSDSDSDYMPPKRSRKKQRRNSEGDIIEIKIKQRSRSDSYFKSQSKENQIAYLNKEQEIYNFLDETIPIRYKILNSSLSINIKSLVINKINIYENMNQDDNEYTKLNKWINGLSKIPFDCFVRLPISIQDGNSKIQNFLLQSYTILKETIYGQNEAKNKIMQILAQWISNPNSQGQVIALEGPAGLRGRRRRHGEARRGEPRPVARERRARRAALLRVRRAVGPRGAGRVPREARGAARAALGELRAQNLLIPIDNSNFLNKPH